MEEISHIVFLDGLPVLDEVPEECELNPARTAFGNQESRHLSASLPVFATLLSDLYECGPSAASICHGPEFVALVRLEGRPKFDGAGWHVVEENSSNALIREKAIRLK